MDHVLKRPDTYIGSVEPITQPMWVYDSEMKSMVHRCVSILSSSSSLIDVHRAKIYDMHSAITFVPGLYKIVDEILVNAADNKVRLRRESKRPDRAARIE